eukprot:SAG31_NODE_7546_length_1659_cov_0.958333_1_plen_86_part_10
MLSMGVQCPSSRSHTASGEAALFLFCFLKRIQNTRSSLDQVANMDAGKRAEIGPLDPLDQHDGGAAVKLLLSIRCHNIVYVEVQEP